VRRAIVIGGGTGGTMVANALDPRKFEVTVISDSPSHMFQPALLYVAFKNAAPRIVREERGLLRSHVRLIEQRVASVDLGSQFVATADGQRHEYDDLVIATGIGADPGQLPGLASVNERFGDYHSTVAQAKKLWSHLNGFTGGTIALGQSSPICKCPPSPVEGILLAEELIRKRGLRDKTRFVFFTPYPRAYPAEAIDNILKPIFEARGIETMTFFDVEKIDVEARTITSIEGDTIAFDLPIIIPPFVGAKIEYRPAGAIDDNRFLKVDKIKLNVLGFDNVYAIGDATDAPTAKSGVTAHLEAKVVAQRLSGRDAAFDGRTNCPMDLAYGKATFVIGSYTAAVIDQRPSWLKHVMKMAMAKVYWLSLRGILEPFFDIYFRLTSPEHRHRQAGAPHEAT
jgi:sulfide:quinone oxidoreductase